MRRPNLYTATLHPPRGDSWLEQARHHDAKLGMATTAIGIVGLLEPGAVLVFPAGLMVSPSPEAGEATAELLRRAAMEALVGVIFGIDVARNGSWGPLDGPPDSYLYACQAGTRLLWPSRVVRPSRHSAEAPPSTPVPIEPRVATLGGHRLGIVAGAEVFQPALRRKLAASAPEVVVVPTHLGPTERWSGALQSLSAIAPVVVTGESRQSSATAPPPLWSLPPDGWSGAVVSRQPGMTLQVLRPARGRGALALAEQALAVTAA